MFSAALILLAIGIGLPAVIAMYHNFEFHWEKESSIHNGTQELVIRMCDCGAETPCPNGRNPKDGSPFRCAILVAKDSKL